MAKRKRLAADSRRFTQINSLLIRARLLYCSDLFLSVEICGRMLPHWSEDRRRIVSYTDGESRVMGEAGEAFYSGEIKS